MAYRTRDRVADRFTPAAERDHVNIGLLIPNSGTMGMYGPSALACARLAVETWQRLGGVGGRPIRLIVVDSSDSNDRLNDEMHALLARHELDAAIALSTTSVCQRVSLLVDASIPLVFTTQFEGAGLPHWVHSIGETPDRQLLPAIDWIVARHRTRRWFMVGNDYCWPRRSNRAAATHLATLGCEVVGCEYLPFGAARFDHVLEQIVHRRADAVLISLIGSDAVRMGRAFGKAGLARRAIRLSVSVEENALLGMGASNTEGLFAASGYYGTIGTDANGAFKELFHARFGERAPVLNSLGQSVYEGFVHLSRRLADGSLQSVRRAGAPRQDDAGVDPIYLAEAQGLELPVIARLGASG